jgi:type IV pilus assembly protein PilX
MRRRQQGMVLIAVLVVLVITLLAGMSVMRTVQTGNAMAGNFAFRQTGMAAADRALTEAISDVAGRVGGGGGNTPTANRYLASIATAVDARGVPTSVDWSKVRCVDEKGDLITEADCARDEGKFRIQYVVERRCKGTPTLTNVADIRAQCEYEPQASAGSPETIALRYRIIVRVRGPRGTESWFEAMVSGPATI